MPSIPYRIVFKESVLHDIRKIPRIILARIEAKISSLSQNPHPSGAEKIQGYDHCYRIRMGAYRVVYEVDSAVRVIAIIRIGHRKDVYRRL